MALADDIFEAWAPPDGLWSAWVKPVPFAHLHPTAPVVEPPATPTVDLAWLPANADGSTAIIVDLPGVLSVEMGRALAQLRGYRPVSLFNAVPCLTNARTTVDVWPTVHALRWNANAIRATGLPWEAPPAFLLDSARRVGELRPFAGTFDNRAITLPTDFPSASLMLSRGIRRAIVVVPDASPPQADLVHVLLRWQEAGVAIESLNFSAERPRPVSITLRKPRWYRSVWYAGLALFTHRPHPFGGFGGYLPEPSAAGVGGGIG